jgi:hypothetical protein
MAGRQRGGIPTRQTPDFGEARASQAACRKIVRKAARKRVRAQTRAAHEVARSHSANGREWNGLCE